MKFKSFFFCIIILIPFFHLNVIGQSIILKGKISDSLKTVLPFVNVIIKSADSISQGTITDIQGAFEFKNIKKQKYFLKVSCLGFNHYSDTINPTEKDTVNLKIILSSTSQSLSEIVVQGKLIEQYADKNVYNITSKETKTASAAFDVLKSLPKLRVDFVNNIISTVSGKSVKILINGMNASSNDLLTMKPENIAKIEFFDIVPTRFASEDIGAVINVITKSAIQGGEFAINSKNAVTTGFSDDNLMVKFVKNNNQLSLNYDFSYRNYKKRTLTHEYSYELNNTNFSRLEQGINSPFYYQTHNFDLKFLNQKSENYIFCIDLMSSILDAGLTQKQDIYLNNISISQTNTFKDVSQEINPSLSVYFFKKLKNQQEFSINLVPTFYNDIYNTSLIQEKSNDTIFHTNSNLESQKYSLIAEGLYTKKFKSFKCNSGFIYSNNISSQKSKFLNTTENNNSTLSKYYFYVEAVGKIKKASYNIGLGYNISVFQSKELNVNFNTQTPKPRITLQYDLTEFSNFRLVSSLSPRTPSLSDLSNNLYYKDSIMAQRGNPNILPYNRIKNTLEYNLAQQKFEINISVLYSYSDKPYLPIIIKNNNLFIETSQNFKWEKSIFPQFNFRINPFKKEWLLFSVSYTLQYFENYNTKLNSLLSHSFNGDLTTIYKNFSFDLIYYNGGKSLDGEYISKNEEALMAQLQYKYKQASFVIGIIQPFFNSIYYESDLVKTSLLNQHSVSNIYDNGNMFYFKLVYNFSFGKRAENANIKLFNKDYDSGVFKSK